MSAASGLPRVAIAAAVVIRAGRVLVQTRPAGKDYAGYWEFPGGKLEPGEDALACAERECREELDLAVRARAPLHEAEWEYPGTAVHVTFVGCDAADGIEPHPREGQQLRWADRDALGELRFLPANAGVLALLSERLSRRA